MRASVLVLLFGTARWAAGQARSTAWQDYIAGPTARLNSPAAISFSHDNDGLITDGAAVLVEDGASATLNRTGAASPQLAIDFGLPVSGKVEVVFGSTITAPLGIAFSQRLEYLDIGSDTSSFHLGDLQVTGRNGMTWRTDQRRGFRYVLLYLTAPGTVQVDAVRVYHTPYLGSADTYDGHFLCDDDLLNRIWYGCVYTVEICTTSGYEVDGPWEIEEGMLSVSYEGPDKGGPYGLSVAGTDWTDYTLDFDFRIMPLGRACGWAFRAADAGNTYMWQIVGAEGGAQANTLRKHVRVNGGYPSITSVNLPFPVAEGTLHHVRMELEGAAIRTRLDGQLVDTTTDTTFGQGRIGFYSDQAYGEHFHVDNVVVSEAAGTLFADGFDSEFLVADWDDWERAELLTINDGAKRDRVWVWGDFYPAQRSMFVAHWEPRIIAETLRDGAEHQYDQAIEDALYGILRGKIPAANGGNYMARDGWHANWLDDYTFWWVLTLHHYWMHTGDLAFVGEMYPALQGVLDDWCIRKMRPDGLINLAQGDWYWSFTREGGATAFNALYARSLQCGAEMAGALGDPAAAADWSGRAQAVAGAINALRFNENAQLYYDGSDRGDSAVYFDRHPLDANTLTVLYGIAPAWQIEAMLLQIKSLMWSPIGTRTAWPDYGTWGHTDQVWAWYVQYEVEARFRHNDDANAFESMRRPWEIMVNGDPGRTMWEFIVPGGGVENGLRNTDHAFSAGAAWLMSEYVAGLRPTSPGFATFDIVPHPGELSWVECTMPTPLGSLSISYNVDRQAQRYDATIGVPAGATGRVAVPKLGRLPSVMLDDEAVWTIDGPVGAGTEDGHYLYLADVGPGLHALAAAFDVGIVGPDFDYDFDVDQVDFGHLQACLTGSGASNPPAGCEDADLDGDHDVDGDDLNVFKNCHTGAGVAPVIGCDK